MEEKSQEEEKDELSVKTVFSIKESEIKQTGKTQCIKHQWRKLTENEVYCPLCESALIVSNIKDYV
jgi:hypothetical protein